MNPNRPEIRPGQGGPELADRVTPQSAHKFCAGVLIATALAFLVQLLTLATLSEESLRQLLERTSLFALLRDEDKARALREAREKLRSGPVLAGKVLAAALLAATAAGLLRGRRKPTRALSAVTCVLLGAASVVIVADFNRLLSSLDFAGGILPWIDLAFAILTPAACVCCFIAAGKRLWKAPHPLLLRPRPGTPPGGTPPAAPGRPEAGAP